MSGGAVRQTTGLFVKRYDLQPVGRFSFSEASHMVEAADGDWVRFEDVEPTLKALQTWLDARKLASSQRLENFGDGSVALLAAALREGAWDK